MWSIFVDTFISVSQLVYCLATLATLDLSDLHVNFAIVGESTLIGRSVNASSMTGSFSLVGLFKSSSKRFTPLFCCSCVAGI